MGKRDQLKDPRKAGEKRQHSRNTRESGCCTCSLLLLLPAASLPGIRTNVLGSSMDTWLAAKV